MIVEHEEALRTVIRRWLGANGYRVLDVGDFPAAELIAKLYVGPIHLILIAVDRSDASVRALADRFRSERPEARVVFMSNRSRSELRDLGALAPRDAFIRKPFERDALITAVSIALAPTR